MYVRLVGPFIFLTSFSSISSFGLMKFSPLHVRGFYLCCACSVVQGERGALDFLILFLLILKTKNVLFFVFPWGEAL